MDKKKCPQCGKEYSNKGISTHIWRAHTVNGKNHKSFAGHIGWNRGLTKNNDERIQKGSDTFFKNLADGKFIPNQTSKPLTDIQRDNVSFGMKKAHKEGRAWNIGKSRWNNKPSYPEIFFAKVIENEFKDKNYEIEYPVGIYSLDFAWVDKKKVIEIDGDQHQRYEEYKSRDKRKDEYLKINGWQVLRIIWKDMYNNTKEEIQKCKDFIDN